MLDHFEELLEGSFLGLLVEDDDVAGELDGGFVVEDFYGLAAETQVDD